MYRFLISRVQSDIELLESHIEIIRIQVQRGRVAEAMILLFPPSSTAATRMLLLTRRGLWHLVHFFFWPCRLQVASRKSPHFLTLRLAAPHVDSVLAFAVFFRFCSLRRRKLSKPLFATATSQLPRNSTVARVAKPLSCLVMTL